ncbi:glycoside hydrolase family 15 protein [Halococcus sp. AFM35]|uniref:glycoside hydrolase family 15 protein n=1 Tax=Halococcus sp. AFM35 TaxID=3421653 RepID=UPI003EBE3710
MDFLPIGDYGVVGNLETCALVGRDGTVDWWCLPHIESPSVFAGILDPAVGGQFTLQPTGRFESEQEYVERTNVLETHFETEGGTATLTDFMPVIGEQQTLDVPEHALYRRVECEAGTVEMDVNFAPRFDYARAETAVEAVDGGVLASATDEELFCQTPVALDVEDATATGTLGLDEGDAVWFICQYGEHERLESAEAAAMLEATVEFWKGWVHHCTDSERCLFYGPWHDLVVRSELVLKLLMRRETSAIAAAPTTSLPEEIGGERNWDYRFNWIRDAAFTIQALHELGHASEVEDFFEECLDQAIEGESGRVEQPFYGVDGEDLPDEEELDHLAGYRGSSPVRIGNAAGDQRQLDVYGELVLAIHETTQYGETLTPDNWTVLRDVIDHVCEVWDEPGYGIWEDRADPKQFVYSKVMCWAAIDRALTMADATDYEAPTDEWESVREDIEARVLEEGFDEEMGSFTRSFETDNVDASLLRLPVVGFLEPDDDRIVGTIETVREQLATENGLVYRYDTDDGLEGEENPFVLCSFWLVDALALAGRSEEARDLYESVLEHATPLGLFAEQVDGETGEQRGNFPQAFSHLGLINSAIYVREGADPRTPTPIGVDAPDSAS